MSKKVLLLPNIRSGWNTGSLIRSADGMGFNEVALCGFTPYPPHKEISKTALGADEYVQWRYFSTVENALKYYQDFWIISLELDDRAIPLSQVKPPQKDMVLILGNEVEGISSDLLHQSDLIAFIPMQGDKHSLNVSIAGAIAMYALSDTRF